MLRTIHENGKVFVLVPEKKYFEFIAMSDDSYDIAAYDRAKELNEEAFPVRLFDAIDKGENPIFVFRKYRKLSIAEIARKSGLSGSYITQIENGKRNASVKTLQKIADILDVDVEILES